MLIYASHQWSSFAPFNYNYLLSNTASENSLRRILLQELEYLKNIMVTVGIGPLIEGCW